MTAGLASPSDTGIDFFESQSKTMAAMFDSIFVSSREVKVEHWLNDVVMVSGTAILDGSVRYPGLWPFTSAMVFGSKF